MGVTKSRKGFPFLALGLYNNRLMAENGLAPLGNFADISYLEEQSKLLMILHYVQWGVSL